MARGITQSDVDRAADALLAQGERPTVDRIRQFLGTGSPNTVTRLLDVWWKALGGRLAVSAEKVAMPEAPASVAALASQFWEQALAESREQASAALEDERTALAAARLEADALVAAARQASEASEARATEAAAALLTAHQRLEDRQQLLDQQSAQIVDLTVQRDQALLRVQQLEADGIELRQRFEALQHEAEVIRVAQSAHLRAVEDRAHAEVDRARQEAREREKALHAAEKAHLARLRELEGELAQSRTLTADANRGLAAEQGRRETLEQQLAEVHRRLDGALQAAPRAFRLGAPRRPAVAPRRPRTR
ncbi:DNA-binding protein [Lysobacter xanthus]